MTKTCKNCRYNEKEHDEFAFLSVHWNISKPPCEKFEAEEVSKSDKKILDNIKVATEIVLKEDKKLFEELGKERPQKAEDETYNEVTHNFLEQELNKEFEKPQKGCGKKIILGKGKWEFYICNSEGKLCPECSNHSPLTNPELDSVNRIDEDKPDVTSAEKEGTHVKTFGFFNLSKKIKFFINYEDPEDYWERKYYILTPDIKEFIRKESILINRMINGEINKGEFWRERLKLAGKELSK